MNTYEILNHCSKVLINYSYPLIGYEFFTKMFYRSSSSVSGCCIEKDFILNNIGKIELVVDDALYKIKNISTSEDLFYSLNFPFEMLCDLYDKFNRLPMFFLVFTKKYKEFVKETCNLYSYEILISFYSKTIEKLSDEEKLLLSII